MTSELSRHEVHPTSRRARLVRSMRWLRNVRGWERITTLMAQQTLDESFVVKNATGLYAGNLLSFVDRRMYLFGEYEELNLDAFLGFVPDARRGVILDVGANVGTHSLAFARHFKQVHAFEPNPALWSSFNRNMAMNGLSNVTLHQRGLADRDAELPFYSIEKNNFGLGTCSPVQQYDLPLKEIGTVQVSRGDDYARQQGIGPIDAIKIDVQGFEPEVLRGLRERLITDRPIVWFEFAGGESEVDMAAQLHEFFPLRVRLLKFEIKRSFMRSRVELEEVQNDRPGYGDYVAVPVE